MDTLIGVLLNVLQACKLQVKQLQGSTLLYGGKALQAGYTGPSRWWYDTQQGIQHGHQHARRPRVSPRYAPRLGRMPQITRSTRCALFVISQHHICASDAQISQWHYLNSALPANHQPPLAFTSRADQAAGLPRQPCFHTRHLLIHRQLAWQCRAAARCATGPILIITRGPVQPPPACVSFASASSAPPLAPAAQPARRRPPSSAPPMAPTPFMSPATPCSSAALPPTAGPPAPSAPTCRQGRIERREPRDSAAADMARWRAT